jgi:hypothetical protein
LTTKAKITWSAHAAVVTVTLVSNDDDVDGGGWYGAVDPATFGHAVVVVAVAVEVTVVAVLDDGRAVVTVAAVDVGAGVVVVVGAAWLVPLVHAARNIATATLAQTVRRPTVRSWHLPPAVTGTGTIHRTGTCAAACRAAGRRRR